MFLEKTLRSNMTDLAYSPSVADKGVRHPTGSQLTGLLRVKAALIRIIVMRGGGRVAIRNHGKLP